MKNGLLMVAFTCSETSPSSRLRRLAADRWASAVCRWSFSISDPTTFCSSSICSQTRQASSKHRVKIQQGFRPHRSAMPHLRKTTKTPHKDAPAAPVTRQPVAWPPASLARHHPSSSPSSPSPPTCPRRRSRRLDMSAALDFPGLPPPYTPLHTLRHPPPRRYCPRCSHTVRLWPPPHSAA